MDDLATNASTIDEITRYLILLFWLPSDRLALVDFGKREIGRAKLTYFWHEINLEGVKTSEDDERAI